MNEAYVTQAMTVLIDRRLYEALEAMERVAARQQAEIDQLREVARLARLVVAVSPNTTDSEWGLAYDRLYDAVIALPESGEGS